MLRNTNPKLLNLIPVFFIILGFILLYASNVTQNATATRNHQTAVENNAYLRLNACIISVPPQSRTPEYLKSCYNTVDKSNGVHLTRYGDAAK